MLVVEGGSTLSRYSGRCFFSINIMSKSEPASALRLHSISRKSVASSVASSTKEAKFGSFRIAALTWEGDTPAISAASLITPEKRSIRKNNGL